MSTGVLRRIAAPVTIAALALAAAVVPAQASSTAGWRIVKRIGPTGHVSALEKVAATGPGDAWAAGFLCSDCTQQPDQLLVEHWTGGAWKQMAMPPEIASNDSGLVSIAAHSARDAWVFAATAAGPVSVRWNGLQWSAHPLPAWVLRGDGSGDDANVAADFGPADVWDFSFAAALQPLLAAHFNGRTWRKVRLPAVPWEVSAPSRHDIWVVGPTRKTMDQGFSKQVEIVMHWNGRSWHSMRLPRVRVGSGALQGLAGLVASGPRDVWAAIATGGPASNPKGLLLHWNGKRWARARAPGGVVNQPIGAVAQDGHGGVWLQGNGPVPKFLLYLYHYNHGRWTRFLMPESTKLNLLGFSWIPGTRSVLAVGHIITGPGRGNTVKGLIARYGR
jgi:hypothetical protein